MEYKKYGIILIYKSPNKSHQVLLQLQKCTAAFMHFLRGISLNYLCAYFTHYEKNLINSGNFAALYFYAFQKTKEELCPEEIRVYNTYYENYQKYSKFDIKQRLQGTSCVEMPWNFLISESDYGSTEQLSALNVLAENNIKIEPELVKSENAFIYKEEMHIGYRTIYTKYVLFPVIIDHKPEFNYVLGQTQVKWFGAEMLRTVDPNKHILFKKIKKTLKDVSQGTIKKNNRKSKK